MSLFDGKCKKEEVTDSQPLGQAHGMHPFPQPPLAAWTEAVIDHMI